MLVADGLGADIGSNFGIEPSAGIFAAGFAGQRQAPLSEAIVEFGFFETCARSPTFLMPSACRWVSMTLPTPGISRTSSGARNLASSPGTIQSTPLGFACAEETFAIRRELPIPTEQFSPRIGLHAFVQSVRGFQRRTVQPFGAGHVEIGFVDRSHFHLRGKCAEDSGELSPNTRGNARDVR